MKINALMETILVIIFAILPFIYLAFIWGTLPEIVPTHFGIDGKPDHFGAKQQLLIVPILLSVMSIGIYFLFKNIDKIDPKQAAKMSKDVFDKLALTMVIFLNSIAISIIHSTISHEIGNLLFIVLGLFFIILGNLMHSLKSNYFIGLRLPWTLENEDNWRKTHQLASKIWFAGGLFILIAALLLPIKMMFIVMLFSVLIMVLIPTIYSYQLFKKNSINN
jgi:uncharacterized membrane protein